MSVMMSLRALFRDACLRPERPEFTQVMVFTEVSNSFIWSCKALCTIASCFPLDLSKGEIQKD